MSDLNSTSGTEDSGVTGRPKTRENIPPITSDLMAKKVDASDDRRHGRHHSENRDFQQRQNHHHRRKHFHNVRIYLSKDEKVPFSALAGVRTALEWSKIPTPPYKKQDTPELEQLDSALRKRYEEQNGAIVAEYYCENTIGAAILTEGPSPLGRLRCALNYPNERLQLMVYRVEELAHEAEEVLATRRVGRSSDQGREHKAETQQRRDPSEARDTVKTPGKQLNWALKACYSALTAVLASADDLADPGKSENERTRRLEATSREIQELTRQVRAVVQRHARFNYFVGVATGTVLTIMLVLGIAALAPQGPERGLDVASMTAAAIGGAVGALVSIFQRLSTGDLLLDFTAPPSQRLILGGLRPLAGAVFGVFAQLALSAGLFQPAEAYSARTLGTYTVIGFLAGFSERFAIDIIERAGRTLLGTEQEKVTVESPPSKNQDIDHFIASPVRREEVTSFPQPAVAATLPTASASNEQNAQEPTPTAN